MLDAAEKVISAGILAGGKSLRMGQNKALLSWRDQTLLEHLAKLVAVATGCNEVLISVAEEAEYRDILKRWQGAAALMPVEDQRRGYGPLEGLYQLLAHGKNPWMFVVATDMPLVSPEFIRQMLGQPLEGAQAVVPRDKGRIHPLCGLYHKSALPALEKLLVRGEHRVRGLLEELSVRYVDLEMTGMDACVLENVNTPEEYRRVRCLKEDKKMRIAVITSSDSGAAGIREDKSGQLICDTVTQLGGQVVSYQLLPDDQWQLEEAMKRIADEGQAELILTTGGTGFSKRDRMPEATEAVSDRRVPGIPEAMRAYSMQFTGRAMLSRASAGIRKETLIVNLPGSPKAIRETLEYLYPHLVHGVEILTGEVSDCGREDKENCRE